MLPSILPAACQCNAPSGLSIWAHDFVVRASALLVLRKLTFSVQASHVAARICLGSRSFTRRGSESKRRQTVDSVPLFRASWRRNISLFLRHTSRSFVNFAQTRKGRSTSCNHRRAPCLHLPGRRRPRAACRHRPGAYLKDRQGCRSLQFGA